MSLLAPDVTLWTDGGGKASAALRPVHGREKVARLITGYAAKRMARRRSRSASGRSTATPSVVVFSDGSPSAVMVVDLDADGDRVTDVYLVTNPDKLGSEARGPRWPRATREVRAGRRGARRPVTDQ